VPRLREIVVLALVALAAASVLPQDGWNATAHYSLVESLADRTPRIDDHLNQGGDIAWVDGHFYAAKSPGLALGSLPLYAALDGVDAVPAKEDTTLGPPGARGVTQRALWQVNLVVVAAFFALLVLVRIVAENLFRGTGLAVALTLGLGSMLLPFATSYFSHVLSALLGFAAFAAIQWERKKRSDSLLAIAGLVAGLAVVTEAPVALVGVAVGAYAVVDRPRVRRGLMYGAGLVFGVLPLAAYNAWAFGSPFRNGYSDAVIELGETGHDIVGANDEGFFGLTHPRLGRAADLLFDERGLFVLTPVAVVALAGLAPLYRRGYRREAWLVGTLSLAMLLYNASYYLPFGGHTPGPRFLVPLLPFLALPLAGAFRSWPRVTAAAAAVSAFWMTTATVAGALLPPDESPTAWVSQVVHGDDLIGSIVGNGRTAELAFALPVAAALTLAFAPVLARARPSLNKTNATEPARSGE
jgi:hypothetical protein